LFFFCLHTAFIWYGKKEGGGVSLPEYWRGSSERSRLGVKENITFSNPGTTPGVWLKGKFHRWSENGLTLIPVDAQHQLEAQKISPLKNRAVVLKRS